MNPVITGYSPASLFTYLEEISAIPRASGNEARIADYLVSFATARGIPVIRDASNNVFMTAPATPGFEDRSAILLQGHTDMVCEKESDCPHSFDTDPLDLYVKDGILRARGTTLGGDDGVAVAMMMAALTEDIPHPRLECLFTSDEERGMSGAISFDYSHVTATELINLDSEEEGVATVSCAGGARITLTWDTERLPVPTDAGKVLSITLSALSGGHSGAEIHLGKGNANNLLCRVLDELYRKTPFCLISIDGGSKDNAITREANALIFTSNPTEVTEAIKPWQALLRAEAVKDDRRLTLRAKKASAAAKAGMLSFKDTSAILSAVLLAPTGALTNCPTDPTLVESSANLGILSTEPTRITAHFLARSSCESRMDALIARYTRLAALTHAAISVHDRYPGWELREHSPLRDDFLAIAKTLFPTLTPKAAAIHAGLECGFILSAVKQELDAISIGPALHHIHTPEEALELASCERLWTLLCALLARK